MIHDVYFSNCSGYQILCHHSFLHDKIDSQASRIAGIRTMSAADHLDIRNPGGSSWGILGIWGSGSHAMNYCSEMFFLANQFMYRLDLLPLLKSSIHAGSSVGRVLCWTWQFINYDACKRLYFFEVRPTGQHETEIPVLQFHGHVPSVRFRVSCQSGVLL